MTTQRIRDAAQALLDAFEADSMAQLLRNQAVARRSENISRYETALAEARTVTCLGTVDLRVRL